MILRFEFRNLILDNLLKEKGIELIDQSKEITTWIRV